MASGGEELHFFFGTRAMRPQWFANEVGIKLKLKWVDLVAGDQKKEEYKKTNWAGTLPFLVDGDAKMAESTAILQYLGEKYRTTKDLLIPFDAKPADKAAYYNSMIYTISTMDQFILPAYLNTFVIPEAYRNPQLVEDGKKRFEESIARVAGEFIKGKQYIAGDKFTIADIVIGYTLGLAAGLNWLNSHPELLAYMQRLKERPSFKKTYDRSNPDYPAAAK